MNYPRIWTLPAYLGLDEGATVPLALAFTAAFLIAVLRRVDSRRSGLVLLAGILSPVTLLALERGNSDLLVFALLPWPLAAGVLKLYPFAVLRKWREIVLAALYVGLTLPDLVAINAATPRSAWFGYGLPVSAAIGPLVIGAIVIGVLAARIGSQPSRDFQAGASVYLATFALGPSWDYRLIFLLLTLPWLAKERPILAGLTLAAMWTPSVPVLDDLATAAIAAGFATLLARAALESLVMWRARRTGGSIRVARAPQA